MLEQRRHERFDCKLEVELLVDHRSHHTTMEDISAGGAALKAMFVSFDSGQKLAIYVTDFGRLTGEVRWKTTQQFGVEFDRETQHGSDLRKLLQHLRSEAVV